MAIISAIAACSAGPARADTQFVPSVSLGTVYLDNLFLVPPGAHATSDWIGELIPRIEVSEHSPNLTGALNYSAQGLLYAHDSELNAIHQTGAGNVTWNPVLNLLFVDARAAYSQQIIDLTQPNNPQNLFGTGNITNELDVMVAPYLKRDFGTMTAQLRFQQSISDFSGGGINNEAGLLQNSRTQVITGDLAADSKDAPLYWHFDGRSARTTFDTAEPFRSDRVSAAISEGVTSWFRLTQNVGAETNILTHSDSGGLNAPFWNVGFKWAWSRQTEFEASAGHRFFGPAYAVLWTHESRLLKYHVSYTETATDSSESTALTDFVPGQLTQDPKAYNGVQRSIDTFDPYIAKQIDAGFDLGLRQTQFAAHVFQTKRRYVNNSGIPASDNPVTGLPAGFLPSGVSDTTRGVEGDVVRFLTPRDQIRLDARFDSEDEVDGFRFRNSYYQVNYIHQLARKLQLSLQAVRFTRSGSEQYRADIFQLQLKKTF